MKIETDTLFLDRDGVINVKIDGGYIKDKSEFIFIPGTLFAINKLSTIFKRIIIITNQQGIGKGIMSELDLNNLHNFMLKKIELSGGRIHKIYYCPHLSSDNCKCRKPAPGMILQSYLDFPEIKKQYSYLVGDSDTDIEAGKQQRLNTVKVSSKYTLFEWYNDLIESIK